MATVSLIAATQSAFASLMTTELNSLASGNAILGGTAINNATNNDMEIAFSVTTGGSITPTGSPYFGVSIYPLNGDGSTYGDGRFGSAATGPTPSNYQSGFAGIPAAAGTQVGTFGTPWMGSRILLPRGTWKPVFYNFSGVTLSSSGNILYYRTTNRQIA